MFRIGNDIVDLTADGIVNKHSEKRFLERVFTRQEQSIIFQAFEPDKVLWALWAAKEAAYKACKKQFYDIIFSPLQFVVIKFPLLTLSHNSFQAVGLLQYRGNIIELTWNIKEAYISCIAVLTDLPEKVYVSQFIKQVDYSCDISGLEKHFTSRELQSVFSPSSLQLRFHAKKLVTGLGLNNIEIIRNRMGEIFGPPKLIVNNQETQHEMSFSHDGMWLAGIVALVNNEQVYYVKVN